MKRPILGITMGDPASIGPEVTVKALSDPAVSGLCRPLVVGDVGILALAAERFAPGITLHAVSQVSQAEFLPGVIDVLQVGGLVPERLELGRVSALGGECAFQYVRRVIGLAQAGQVDATVTNALSKEAIHLAGHPFPGHTEIFAHYTGAEKYAMLLAYEDLRVIHVSTHVSLREACDRVKKDRVLEIVRMAHGACRALGVEAPRVAVAGLNPHCGEEGLFGNEERTEIAPAVAAARAMGIRAEGPIPPDTVFPKARGGWYDVVVAMYHDQGHIPLKMAGFRYDPAAGRWASVAGVNITLGLPIIRTSVDHGTAFDLAWKGEANEQSLKSAIDYAVRLSNGTVK